MEQDSTHIATSLTLIILIPNYCIKYLLGIVLTKTLSNACQTLFYLDE